MQYTVVEVTLEPGEKFNYISYADVHSDARDCDLNSWKRHYARWAKVPKTYFGTHGDFNNLVMHGDAKRHTPEVPRAKFASIQNYFNEVVKDNLELIGAQPDAKWVLWGMGNHENSALKFSHYDVPEAMASALGCSYGTYCGLLTFRLRRAGSKHSYVPFRVLYHHGAWGGKAIRGFSGARDWASRHSPWNVFLYGHNHYEGMQVDPVWNHASGKIWDTPYVNTGGWLKSCSRIGQTPDYAEVKGFPITTIGTPVISAWYERERCKGRDDMVLNYSVTTEFREARIAT